MRLPLDELAAAGVDPACLARPPWPPALAAVLRARHSALLAQLAAAVASVPRTAQPALRPLLVWAALAARADHGALDGWRAWRAARRAGAGRFEL